jgi:hypothetical protein
VRRQQKAPLQTVFTGNVLQPQDYKLRLADGCRLRAQRYNKAGDPATTDMWTEQVCSTGDEEEGLLRLHTLLYLHQ